MSAHLPDAPLRLDRMASPLGTMLLVTDGDGRLRGLDWDDREARLLDLQRLHGCPPGGLVEGRAPSLLRDALAAYFAGELNAIDGIVTATGGTAFQRAVWAGLRAIPVGVTISSAGKRLGAYLFEVVLCTVTLVIGWMIWSLIVFGKGQTPAKQLLGMKVVQDATALVELGRRRRRTELPAPRPGPPVELRLV